ncbi:MAG: hypothetical protein SGJ17_11580 [Hyphomicrobiales bacterium]|nr:hypothetical protein [Hyphomicrobiales bacterium]
MIYLREFSRSLWLLRAPIIIVMLFGFLMQQEQILEIYSIMQQGNYKSAALALLSLVGFSLVVWGVGRDLCLADARDHAPDTILKPGPKGHILRNMPAIIACLPLVFVTLGMSDYSYTLEKSFGARSTTQDTSEAEPSSGPASATYSGMGQTLNANADRLSEFNDLLGVAVDGSIGTASVIQNLKRAGYGLAALTLVFAIFVFWRANFSIVRDIRLVTKTGILLTALLFAVCLGIAAAQTTSWNSIDFTSIPRAVGAIFVINLFLICITVFMAGLTRLNDVQGIPLLTFIVGAALIGSANNWNDNHGMKIVSVAPQQMTSRAAAQVQARAPEFTNHQNARPLPVAFLDWFDQRPQARREMFATDGQANPANPNAKVRKYPVYIVAAQGGGLYASYLAAIALARLYDQCPALRHHVFAISGVSGGSVGAGLVSALLQNVETKGYNADDAPCPEPTPLAVGERVIPGPLERRVKDYFSGDLLSPLAASALFADFPQRVVPFLVPGVSGHLDRSRAFEAGLETQWSTLISEWEGGSNDFPNPFSAPFRDQWRSDGHAPMLVLNITAVNSGQQVLAAPFVSDRALYYHVNNSSLHSIYPAVLRASEDISLSTAVSLSARFPIVLSPASKQFNKTIVRFGDGGYYENSGVDTALSMVRDLKFFKENTELLIRPQPGALTSAEYENIEFRLIILNEHYKPDLNSGGFHETLSPLLGLYNTRTHRGRLAIDRALASGVPVQMIRLMHGLFPLPLGWQFADHTSNAIQTQIGTGRECRGNAQFKRRMREFKKFLQTQAAAQLNDKAEIEKLKELPVLARLLQENRCTQRDVIRAIGSTQAVEAQ